MAGPEPPPLPPQPLSSVANISAAAGASRTARDMEPPPPCSRCERNFPPEGGFTALLTLPSCSPASVLQRGSPRVSFLRGLHQEYRGRGKRSRIERVEYAGERQLAQCRIVVHERYVSIPVALVGQPPQRAPRKMILRCTQATA